MNRTLTYCLVLIGLFGATTLSAQELTGAAAAKRIPGAVNVRLEANGRTPAFVAFNEAKTTSIADITALQQQMFGGRPEDSWSLIRSEDDQIGMTHVRYQQQYQQLDVEGQVYIFHAKGGNIVSANGHFLPNIALSTTPAITPEQALTLAAAGMKKPLELELAETTDVQLVVLPLDRKPVLAYKCGIFSPKPLVNQIVYVDATNGSILREVSRICSTDVPGTAATFYSGTQPIMATQISNGFRLRESGRGNGIETYKSTTQQLFFDNDNLWNNVDTDRFGVDAHFGSEATYDFFKIHFGRNSYDNNGGVIRSEVNDVTVWVNAYWSGGPDNTAHYGIGDNNHFAVVSLDIVGHELSHGVTEYTAGLEYFGESGALNESFSDIFGNTIRFLTTPSVATWYIGDQLHHPGAPGDIAFRNMSNPNEFGNADTYEGLYFNDGDVVHYDSGIQNFWYYLLVEGGNGTNDIGNAYTVTGIGLEDAVKIAYRNLAYYLTPTSTFLDARYGAEQAAGDLFGVCSPQQVQTIKAWYAVGVGGPEVSFQPVAAYTVSNDFSCTAPLSTQFFGDGAYESYFWDFGDGDTSWQQNPAHVYENEGYYTVTLIVSNHLTCLRPDTMMVPNNIVVDSINPVAAFGTAGVVAMQSPFTFVDQSLYGPVSWEWDFGDGTTSTLQNPVHTYADTGSYTVTLIVQNCHGSDTLIQQVESMRYLTICEDLIVTNPSGVIFDPGGPNGDYPASGQNCILRIRPCNASLITLTIEELNMHEWDGIVVSDGEQLFEYFVGALPPTTLTSISGRFDIYYFSDSIFDGLPGFRISYTSELNAIPDSMSASWYSIPQTSFAGQEVNFYDNSEYYPVSWAWDFGDGTVSDLKYPHHTFELPGTYNVKLTVTYCDGSTDVDSTSHYACCTADTSNLGMEELSIGNLLTVYPNPSSGAFVIAPGVALSHVVFSLHDMSGREVYRNAAGEVAPEGMTVDASALGNGQYILEIQYELNGSPGMERRKLQVLH